MKKTKEVFTQMREQEERFAKMLQHEAVVYENVNPLTNLFQSFEVLYAKDRNKNQTK
tara:strand:+ start:11194 stop:11364 length:171 start_codon:yes stop_codon:yes gene_type:complete